MRTGLGLGLSKPSFPAVLGFNIEASKSMILEFTVTDVGDGGSGLVTLPLAGAFGVYVAFGDAGDISDDDVYVTGEVCNHTYGNGVYICKISKSGAGLPAFGGGSDWDAGNYLTRVLAFGSGLGLTSLSRGFQSCENLLSVPDTALPSTVLDLSYTFRLCANSIHGFTHWDTSNVTNMKYLFSSSPFNQDISNWDTSSVENMDAMFYDASAFNQNIGSWDTALVENMQAMFYQARAFNQDIGAWDITSIVYPGGYTGMRTMLTGSGTSTPTNLKENFEATIIGWASTVAGNSDQPTNITLGCPEVSVDNADAITAINYLSGLSWSFVPDPLD